MEVVVVVEDLILKGYYNHSHTGNFVNFVVEDLILKGYYNSYVKRKNKSVLWKTLF